MTSLSTEETSFLAEAEKLFKKLDRIEKFEKKHQVMPFKEAEKTTKGLYKLTKKLPDIDAPKNENELFQAELKRRLTGEASHLDHRLSGEFYNFDKIISIYGIPKDDIIELHSWLTLNREKTLEAIERLFKTSDIRHYDLGLLADIPRIRREAESLAETTIRKYHMKLGKLLQNTKVGDYLRDIEAVPTNQERSYFDELMNTLAISIPAIVFVSEDGNIHIRDCELIRLYGHEGMGHGLNAVVTQSSNLPYFLKKGSATTIATEESVSQFYERVIFEHLKSSPETQKDLDIEHRFNDIYQQFQDTRLLEDYKLKLIQYAITVLADKTLRSSEEKAKKIAEVTLDPNWPKRFVDRNKLNYDFEGNLQPGLVSELRYCVQPVKRALKTFQDQGIIYEGKGINIIDSVLLTGFWTPIGYVDNARLKAEKIKR